MTKKNANLKSAGLLIGAAVAVLFLMPGAARAGAPDDDRVLRNPTELGLVRASYMDNCAQCHGRTGDGRAGSPATANSGIPDFTTPSAVTAIPRGNMIRAIESGHDDAVRARWAGRLDARAIENIVIYIRDTFMPPANLDDASIGRQIFAHGCSVCHGDRGDGRSWATDSLDPPPADFTSGIYLNAERQDLIDLVTFGKEETAMVGFASQMSAEEIASVVDYIIGAFIRPDEQPAEQAAESPRDAEFERKAAFVETAFSADLIGDRDRGKVFFDANCADCHGLGGKGDGRRAHIQNPRPRDLTSVESRALFSRPRLFTSISLGRVGSDMPAWSKVLSDQQIADVAEYVFTAFLRPAQKQAAGDIKKKTE